MQRKVTKTKRPLYFIGYEFGFLWNFADRILFLFDFLATAFLKKNMFQTFLQSHVLLSFPFQYFF